MPTLEIGFSTQAPSSVARPAPIGGRGSSIGCAGTGSARRRIVSAHEREDQDRQEARRDQPGRGRCVEEPELDADHRRGDDEGQRGRLEQPRDDGLAIPDRRAVDERRERSHDEQRGEEERHARNRRSAPEERVEIELEPARDEEDRDEHPEAGGLELHPEAGVGHHPIAVGEREHGPGQEGSENHLEPEPLGQSDESDQEEEGAADADLRRGVLETRQHRGQPPPVLDAEKSEQERDRDQEEADQEQDLRRRAGGLAREEEGEQDHGAEVGDRGGGDDELAEVRPELVGVLEHRDDDAERGRHEDDRDEQRRVDLARRVEGDANHDGDAEREREAPADQPEPTAAKLLEFDLESSQEEQEREADQREHPDRLVDLDPAEPRRADRDAGNELEHDRGQAQRGRKSEHKRRREGDCHDDQKIREVDLGHAEP
jgi:hypothetical protein